MGKKEKPTPVVEQVPIEKLIPNDQNPRHNDEAVDAVARSIQAYGFNNPIVTDGDLRIAAGHTRLKAAEKLGLKTVPVIRIPGLVGSQFIGFAIADNATAEIAEWDSELLNNLVSELNLEVDFDLSSLGFDEMELTKILDWGKDEEREDEVPPVPDVPITEPGDLWILGNHRLLCGDATNTEDVEKLMDGERADMVFTDPPYGLGFQYNDYDDTKDKGKHATFCGKWWSVLKLFSDFIVVTPGFDNEALFFSIEPSFSVVTWHKKFSISSSRVAFARVTEPILIYGKLPVTRYDTDFFEYGTDREEGLHEDHPCPKPINLVIALTTKQTNRGDIILDVFGGSGTTLIAAEKTGRYCYMMEIDPRYCDVVVKRWEAYTGKKAERDEQVREATSG